MSNINRELEYDNITDWNDFVSDQFKKNLYTCLPGLIVSYETSTKRATIESAIRRVKTDGTTMDYPSLLDVPILFPSGGGYILQFPLDVGDPVLVLFSQRDLTDFKSTFEKSTPNNYGMFTLKDSIAIPGFGALTNVPAVPDALTIQNTTGTSYISMTSTNTTIQSTRVDINGALFINGVPYTP